jgi:hypothetical protein
MALDLVRFNSRWGRIHFSSATTVSRLAPAHLTPFPTGTVWNVNLTPSIFICSQGYECVERYLLSIIHLRGVVFNLAWLALFLCHLACFYRHETDGWADDAAVAMFVLFTALFTWLVSQWHDVHTEWWWRHSAASDNVTTSRSVTVVSTHIQPGRRGVVETRHRARVLILNQ